MKNEKNTLFVDCTHAFMDNIYSYPLIHTYENYIKRNFKMWAITTTDWDFRIKKRIWKCYCLFKLIGGIHAQTVIEIIYELIRESHEYILDLYVYSQRFRIIYRPNLLETVFYTFEIVYYLCYWVGWCYGSYELWIIMKTKNYYLK